MKPKRILQLSKEYVYWKYALATTFKNKNRTALASFPRSGNTWTRVLIENLTGELSGSIYKDRVFTRESEGVVIKTHARDSFKYNKAIVISRKPYDAIESYYHWRRDFSNNQGLDWAIHVKEAVQQWKNFHQHWLNINYAKHIVLYENLLEHPQENLSKMAKFLERQHSEQEIATAIEAATIDKLRKNEEAGKSGTRFFRKGKKNEGATHFSPEQITLVKTQLGPIAQQLGYNL